MILIGRLPKSGKSTLTLAIKDAFWLSHFPVNNPKYWVYNEAGTDKGKLNLWLYCNDSFYQRGGGREVDHNRMNQSIHSTHSRFSPEGEPDRTVTIVEGHRVFQNEQLVRQSSILIWVHSPRQSRRLRHKNKSFSDEEWSQKCVIERRYFDSS